jgi:hypothetical protein
VQLLSSRSVAGAIRGTEQRSAVNWGLAKCSVGSSALFTRMDFERADTIAFAPLSAEVAVLAR